MRIYVGLRGLEIAKSGYTSLKGICEEMGVSYQKASRGKRTFIVGDEMDEVIRIFEVEIVKVSGRGKHLKR